MVHVHLAERLGVPLHLLSGIPYSPTADMPHPLVETMAHDDQLSNWLSYSQVHKFVWNQFRETINKLRVQRLQLAPWNTKDAPAWWQWHISISYYWSSLLLSKRQDWGDEVDVAGFVQLDGGELSYVPKPELSEFMARQGLRRVFISLPGLNTDVLIAMAEVVVSSRSDIQVVIGQECDLDGPMVLSDRLVVLDASVPLTWLVKNCHAVIHQASDARLVAEILHQSKPSVAAPVSSMEKLWANHLHDMDPEAHLSSVRLETIAGRSDRLTDLVMKLMAIRRTVSSIYRQLPVQAMQCDVVPSKLAHVYDPVQGLKLSHEVAYVANQLETINFVKYTPMYYSLYHQPQVASKAELSPKAASPTEMDMASAPPAASPGLIHQMSLPSLPINTTSFWTSQSDEVEFRKRVNNGYDKLLASRSAAHTTLK
ncbi:hypothetical protein Ae201684P_011286 [Aphanomyces euteiches]|uniref:Uncharacterized protein n=1 Tax=Aphanomyces euteiches TaxID=100861 RepID=A0A6G0XXT1_9STRA|nr:hypothetical protein Ae201684_000347 [Aphanomyces euteiches]KAH9091742.1 hypothetical protein Ae201684P_011286 [Aphanomyces euteiches]KAH9149784.1 hypothetical protein AeRB84_007261 [Aphanomyces euteiches]